MVLHHGRPIVRRALKPAIDLAGLEVGLEKDRGGCEDNGALVEDGAPGCFPIDQGEQGSGEYRDTRYRENPDPVRPFGPFDSADDKRHQQSESQLKQGLPGFFLL